MLKAGSIADSLAGVPSAMRTDLAVDLEVGIREKPLDQPRNGDCRDAHEVPIRLLVC